MVEIKVDSTVLKAIHQAASAAEFDIESLALIVKNKRVYMKQRNTNATAMISFESAEQDIDEKVDMTVPIKTSDLKSIISLAKEGTVVLDIEPGYLTCKVGKVKKKIPQIAAVQIQEKIPNLKFGAELYLSEEHVSDMITAFAEFTEGDVTVNVYEGIAVFAVEDMSRRTDYELTQADVGSNSRFLDPKSEVPKLFSAFEKNMFISTLKNKQKGAEMNLMVGEGIPAKFIVKTDKFTNTVIIAPKIYD